MFLGIEPMRERERERGGELFHVPRDLILNDYIQCPPPTPRSIVLVFHTAIILSKRRAERVHCACIAYRTLCGVYI